MFGALLEYSIILLHLKIYSVLQGIPENQSLLTLTRGVLPSGILGGEVPGSPMVSGSTNPEKNSNIASSENQNENGIRPIQEHKFSKGRPFGSLKGKEDVSPSEATAKLLRKNRMIARLDIVCLIIFPIVFILYGVIYLMTTLTV